MVRSATWCMAMAAGTIFLTVAPAGAQSIHGRLVEARSGTSVPGAFVALLDASGKQRDAALTDAAGRFVLEAPAPGEYTIGIERIGFVSTISDPIELAAGEVLDHRLGVAVEPIELAGISVTIETDCRVRPGKEHDASRLWQEARKALNMTAFAQDRGLLRHAITKWERVLDPSSLGVREERSRSRTGVSQGSPYVSVPPELLAHVGFARVEGQEVVYYGPDADILLSDEFLDGHCFEVRAPPAGEPGWIGLGFEPVRDRRLPDISGTMWLDATTGELRLLEYDYTHLPAPLQGKGAGGRIEFDRVESGEWYVSRWWIRMPVVRVREGPPPAHPTIRAELRLAGLAWIEEEGGQVDRIESVRAAPGAPAEPWPEPLDLPADPAVAAAEGTGDPAGWAAEGAAIVVWRATGEAAARVGVTALDAETGEPIEGVQVHLPGLGLGGSTGPAGRLDLPAVPPGERVLALERLGYRSVEVRVTLGAGEAVEIEARLELAP
ncbi:MAG TPA: carboxypeptidase regulatory-like domain-containing protein [Gemmatimonadota bacterium]|nr:carboxypeptidase regulatory-like domain-containing protein [Gemmatimonadota bacterium]